MVLFFCLFTSRLYLIRLSSDARIQSKIRAVRSTCQQGTLPRDLAYRGLSSGAAPHQIRPRIVLRNAPNFLRHCLYRFGAARRFFAHQRRHFRLTEMVTRRRTGENQCKTSRLCFTTLWFELFEFFFLFGHRHRRSIARVTLGSHRARRAIGFKYRLRFAAIYFSALSTTKQEQGRARFESIGTT